MSNLAMTSEEEKQLDSQVEQMMDWAKSRQAEAEQLALDSARLMACSTDRVDHLKKQGFFQRCWNRFTGKAGEMERANVSDVIQMQKISFRYVNMLQEQQVLMAHSLLSLKNNLCSLAVKEEETRNLIGMLAQRTFERFENLESRVDQIEISTNLQGWLLGLEEREYDEKIPTENMRLFRVINDFYRIKKDNWNYNDLMFMRKAIRTVGLNPKKKLSLNAFIDNLTDEIQSDGVGFEAYGKAITQYQPKSIDNYSKYVLDNISSPVFVSLHALKTQYMDRLDIVEELEDEMNISTSEALKRLLRRSIANMNVELDYEFPLAETAIEILGCLRLAEKLASESETVPEISAQSLPESQVLVSDPNENKSDVAKENHEAQEKFDVRSMIGARWDKGKSIDVDDSTVAEIIYHDNTYYALCLRLIKDNYSFFSCYSSDLKKWQIISTIPATSLPERNSIFRSRSFVDALYGRFTLDDTYGLSFLDGKLLFIIANSLFFTDNISPAISNDEFDATTSCTMLNISKVDLPKQFNGDDMMYRNIYFHEGKWYIFGGVHYENLGEYHPKLLLYGQDLNDLRSLSLLDYTPDYKVEYPINFYKGNFYAYASKVIDGMGYSAIFISPDGKVWDRKIVSESSFSPYSMAVHNDYVFFTRCNYKISGHPFELWKFNPSTGEFSEVPTLGMDAKGLSGSEDEKLKLISCTHFGAVMAGFKRRYTNQGTYIFVSNDMERWVPIPPMDGIDYNNIAIAGDHLIHWDISGKLYFTKNE